MSSEFMSLHYLPPNYPAIFQRCLLGLLLLELSTYRSSKLKHQRSSVCFLWISILLHSFSMPYILLDYP